MEDRFGVYGVSDLVPRYNISPTQAVPVVVELPGGNREMRLMRWGLIPGWARDISIGDRLFNARAETLAEKPSFRTAFKRRRCLLPASGFYEWQGERGAKQPFFVHLRDEEAFALAGLWEYWEGPEGALETCTVITTEPNELIAPMHNRMPVILPRNAYDIWLDLGNQRPGSLQPLLAPYRADAMEAFPVDKRVSNPRFESPECVARLT